MTDSEYALFNQSEGFPTDLDNLASAFSYPFDNCWCKTVSYTVTNGRLVITSNYSEGGDFYGVETCCRAAIIPTNHPDKAYLSQILLDIERIKRKPEAAEPVLEWVYEIQGLGVPPVLTCKSCVSPASIILNSGETYKFGTTKDVGGFQASIESNNGRYPVWARPIYGFSEFNFVGVIRPDANVLAIQKVNEPIPKNDARLLEKTLIFNYILSNTQQPALRARGIYANHDLPPGNPIAR